MPKTVYNTATTINGFLADENDSLSWLFEVNQKDDNDGFARFLAGIGAMCMGSTTYEWVLREEKLLEKPERWQEFYGERPTWVFTHRQLPAIPGADIRFASGDVGPVHDEMVAAAGERDVWIAGGGELVGQFADQGRLDELRFSVAPVTLTGGAPLLPRRLTASRLELVSVNRNGQFAELTYRVMNA
ncbi:dihydrofolate reductase family protein [Stackebrandtia nassauensis]|uniref:Deaminase-reductase domain-containing protein n=1 Tax=Stackebrandtia nassauensis (strain DSM 44728 / CIP 108903 / NRRL B-16338 / NBRC 102104 / LLR-40K-21) TaxID=446470 RepID=D3PZT5_STANL|nr:dihydrofolate reductase family protein [Stackebrandtia nassauensis]ADD43622.1 deaminase-reductase domain-containing protein [Stackebrandtia nassauensis DSM 44728]